MDVLIAMAILAWLTSGMWGYMMMRGRFINRFGRSSWELEHVFMGIFSAVTIGPFFILVTLVIWRSIYD